MDEAPGREIAKFLFLCFLMKAPRSWPQGADFTVTQMQKWAGPEDNGLETQARCSTSFGAKRASLKLTFACFHESVS